MNLRSRLESDMGSLVVAVVGHQHEWVMFSCGNESQLVKNIMVSIRCLHLAVLNDGENRILFIALVQK